MRKKITPDKLRANSLKQMAKQSLERLNSFDKQKYPSNTLTDYYDIIHQLMEAISLSFGIKFYGDSAHKNLIDWTSKELKFNFEQISFLQSLREYRNRISYEGFFVNPDFIKRNDSKINLIISILINSLEEAI